MNLISQVKMKLTLIKKYLARKKNNLTRFKMKVSLLHKNKMHLKNYLKNPLQKSHNWNN
jgi:hypothetical protein